MADIRMHRKHKLGLPRARKVAHAWAEHVEQKFGMQCSFAESAQGDVVEFRRTGVNGSLRVGADHFDLQARLGFLLGVFSRNIEAEIEKHLDELLEKSAATAKPAKKAAPAKNKPAPTKRAAAKK